MIDIFSFLLQLHVLQTSKGESLLTATVEPHGTITVSCGTEEAHYTNLCWVRLM